MMNAQTPGMFIRLPDWPERLAACIAERRHRPFAWGEHDCCQFVAAAIQAMTDHNPLESLGYHDARSAMRILHKEGGLERAVEARLGASKPVTLAMRGDIALLPRGKRQALGVVMGQSAFFAAPMGLSEWPITRCTVAWSV
jgi:hypothetical protein